MNDIFEQLKNQRNDERLGASNFEIKKQKRAQIMAAIGSDQKEPASLPLQETAFTRAIWTLQAALRQPAISAAMIGVLLIGGIGTFQGAHAALPGDTLYSLKLATEQARLQFASYESRAVLHTQYAERRLQEVVALKGASRGEHIESTMTALKKELQLADGQLKLLQVEGGSEAAKVAQEIDEKIDTLTIALNTEAENDPEAVLTESVKQAEDASRAVSETVTDVLVETHEQSEEVVTSADLSKKFKEDYVAIQSRQTFDYGRLVVIQNFFDVNPDLITDTFLAGADTAALNFQLAKSTEDVSQAMSFMAAGGFRAAFDILEATTQDILAIEAELAEIEIGIMTAQSMSEEQAVSEQQEGEVSINTEGIEEITEVIK